MKKSLLFLGALGTVSVALAAVAFLVANTPAPVDVAIPQGDDGIEISMPLANTIAVSPLKITGMVKGNGWTGFEGQVGTVTLFDAAGKKLGMAMLTASADWMQLPTPFETTLFFDYPGDGTGKLVFYNENVSGEAGGNTTFELPVKLAKSSAEKTEVKAFFTTAATAENCSEVFPVWRQLPKIDGVARAALEELLKGPSGSEKLAGFSTAINPGAQIQGLTIQDGVARVDFNEQLQDGVAGSCTVTAIRAQIEQTLRQFPGVTSVIISINGNTEDILQP